jgi:sulfate/thiosulfate transport system ATP-binding protein
LRLVQLDGLASRFPSQLSGGQRQRVALARALAIEPRVLLLDEPFGALDAKVRKDLRRWLRDLHQRLGLTSIFVTHDQEEALELADQVVVMRQSRIEQIGSPRQIYDRPATPFVYEFLGSANRLPCHVRAGLIELAGGRFAAPSGIVEGPAWLFVRPHDLAVEPPDRAQRMAATLTAVMTTGPTYRLQLKLAQSDAEVEAEMAKTRFDALGLTPGAVVALRPREFGLFAAPELDVSAATSVPEDGVPALQAAVA